MTTVSFVIPVRNDARALERCLTSVMRAAANASPALEAEVIVIDNGSTDGSATVGRKFGATVLELPGLKVSELRNRGAAASRGSLIAFVDADHEIGEGWLRSFAEATLEPHAGAVGALCVCPPSATWVQRLYDLLRGHQDGRRYVEWLGSGNMVVRRVAFEQVKGFDTRLETCEDVDLSNRLRASGWRIVSDSRLHSIHYGDPATLGRLFRGELWRGRDNVRVTLRGPLTARSLPSLLLPVVGLSGLTGIAAGLVGLPFGWGALSVGGLLLVALVSAVRCVQITMRLPAVSFGLLCQTGAVAIVYEVARACALVFRLGYRRRTVPLAGARSALVE